MARLYAPETWLKENAKPSWMIDLLLTPMHHEDTSMIKREHHKLTGREAGKIPSLIRSYEDGLPAAGEEAGLEDRVNLSDPKVIVRIPRRNGGHIKFSMCYDHYEDSWFDCYNPPDSPKDKPVKFVELKLLGKKKPTKKKKPAPKPTQVGKMAAWLENLSPQTLSVEVSFDKSPAATFTEKNWQDLVESIRSNAKAKMIDLVIWAKRKSGTRVAYAVYQDRQWQSMPAKDVELLYSVDVEKLEYARPKKNLSFASFKSAYPDSPARKELVDLGVKLAKKKPAPRKARR